MILVDTSVWIDHLDRGNSELASLLAEIRVLMHPFVIGELACGNLGNREETLRTFRALPSAKSATEEEVLELLERHKLWGTGIGWVDAHLITSALLTHCRLWTLDKRLQKTAASVGAA